MHALVDAQRLGLLLRSRIRVGGMAEICARTLQPPRAPWLDLSGVSSALTQEMLEKVTGGILFVPDLSALGKMQQMNLAFAVERLEKLNLQLIAASVVARCAASSSAATWPSCTRLASTSARDWGSSSRSIACSRITFWSARPMP